MLFEQPLLEFALLDHVMLLCAAFGQTQMGEHHWEKEPRLLPNRLPYICRHQSEDFFEEPIGLGFGLGVRLYRSSGAEPRHARFLSSVDMSGNPKLVPTHTSAGLRQFLSPPQDRLPRGDPAFTADWDIIPLQPSGHFFGCCLSCHAGIEQVIDGK